ncbi:MAG: o-succinylbenzoate synthase [Bacteroidales bacterium]|nr:o-succinylbenzoate synthase [Bacteroidales bacterium]MBN2819800.1 o-succinylbenzoate synthase [Bacteroidales bacterium]
MKAYFQKRILSFKHPAGTSRGILLSKPSWYVYLYDPNRPYMKGIGECSIIPGLSIDDEEQIESRLYDICSEINRGTFNFEKPIYEFPALNFAIETALLDYQVKGTKLLFPSEFTEGTKGIAINALVWMGDMREMYRQVEQKIEKGFTCVKLKIGALDLDDELFLLSNLRKKYSSSDLEIRVDANGSFSYSKVHDVLNKLADLNIHSIEQPIFPTQISEMAELCSTTPIPIALDEELIGKYPLENKRKLLEIIKPQYIVLKPSLIGGFKEATDWINIASEFNIRWWVTSALESNIGLNAIAQWSFDLGSKMPQGLGTGSLFKQNVESPLEVRGQKLFYNPELNWNFEFVY